MKTKSKQATHTPGPWQARDYKTDDGDIWIDCVSSRGGTLATAHATGTGSGTVESNARLITAAPAMLEALEKIYNDPYTTCCCSEIAKVAIKLARGE